MNAKTLKSVLLLVVIFVVIPFGILALLWKDKCKTERQTELAQPDGAHLATIHVTRCENLKPATEIRVDDKPVMLYQGDQAPELAWAPGGLLRIGYPKGSEVVSRHPPVPGVGVDIVESDR